MAARRRRYQTAVENLGLDDIRTPDDYESEGTLALTRQHLAQALVAAGHASSLHDAFQNFANRDNVPIMDVPYTQCIEMAREMGATTSWAHPPVTDLKKHIETFKKAGLHGIEAMRPSLGATAKKTYKKMAKRHDLILTGVQIGTDGGIRHWVCFSVSTTYSRSFLNFGLLQHDATHNGFTRLRGYAPGMNAAITAVVKTAASLEWDVLVWRMDTTA